MSDPATAPLEAIAIVGMAGRFPKAPNLDEFWTKLEAGEELVTFFTDAELEAGNTPVELLHNPAYVKARAVLENAELFDAAFFGINPREAELMDPQQRILLECAWEALEHAGYDPDRYTGAVGVYAGLSMGSYLLNNLVRNQQVLATAGAHDLMITNDKDFLTTRVSYKLNLRGPSIDVQSACSTSLVAVQLACQSLLSYQCDMALAGGVSVGSPRAAGYLYQPGMIMSPDGHCRAFDARGRGIVGGEGAGLIVLKRLSEAVADGDTIHAIIRGAAINNDGAQKVGYTAPSVDGQAEVIALAQAIAGVGPESITYVEAHGTATELGDPIEVAALTQAFRLGTDAEGYCALGSVKTNMGHLDAAAGVAGLLKTVLALKHRRLPPSLHFETPNPNIDFASSPFYVNTSSREWPSADGPRFAGVSSFGIGGTNAHVILEEAPDVVSAPTTRPSQLFLLSGRTVRAVEQATADLAGYLRNHPDSDVADVAYTLQSGRRAFGERRIVIVDAEGQHAAATLESRDPRRVFDASTDARDRQTAFLFTGQGSQYVNMARQLYATEPLFRAEIDGCAELLRPHLGLDVREVLYPPAAGEEAAAQQLSQTALAQPALFVVEYALARLWMSWGVQPTAMLGHSIGEYVAACVAGVFTLDDALAVVAARGRLMQEMPGGSMLAVSLSEADLLDELDSAIALAAINGPSDSVVAGPTDKVRMLQNRLEARGVDCRLLHTSHAFHSPMMDPILGPFTDIMSRIRLSPPAIPYVSNLTGTWITSEQAMDPAYWAAHLRSTVRFADGASLLLSSPDRPQLLELGPGQALSSLVKGHPARSAGQVPLSALRHPHDVLSDHAFLMQALGRLWLGGARIDWTAVHGSEARHRVPLPTYPFERQRYWVEPQTAVLGPSVSAATNTVPVRREDVSTWFYQPSWRRVDIAALPSVSQPARHNWLLFLDEVGLGERLAQQLTTAGQHVVRVLAGQRFAHDARDRYHLAPGDPADYRLLVEGLRADDLSPDRIVHLWNVGSEPVESPGSRPADLAFYSLLFLAQALGDSGAAPRVRIDVFTSGMCDVDGQEPLVPMRALVLGPCRVIPQEYPHLSCRCIDLVEPTGSIDDRSVKAAWLDLWSDAAEPLVAHRGAHRWVSAFEPVALGQVVSASAPPLRERGVYLITGGVSGIGLVLAEYLARSTHARLVLTARRSVPEPAYWDAWLAEHGPDDGLSRMIASVRSMEAEGAEVLVARADVTDLCAMQALVARTRRRFGEINGVIHAAGVAGGGIIPLKSRHMAEDVLAPKVGGTLVLEAALRDEPLDFFALCSSATSILGGPGQVDYCAANAFLGAFAHARHRDGRRTVAIDWSAWQEVGMAVDTPVPPHLQRIKEENLRMGVRSSEGVDAFGRVLSGDLPEVVVSPQDFQQVQRLFAPVQPGSTEHGLAASADAVNGDGGTPAALYARPDVPTAFVAPRNDLEAQVAEIWSALLGIREIGVHDNFFDLGGHSLLATRLIARLQQSFGVDLPLRSIFESPTVAELAERVGTIIWAAENSASSANGTHTTTGEREEIEL